MTLYRSFIAIHMIDEKPKRKQIRLVAVDCEALHAVPLRTFDDGASSY